MQVLTSSLWRIQNKDKGKVGTGPARLHACVGRTLQTRAWLTAVV